MYARRFSGSRPPRAPAPKSMSGNDSGVSPRRGLRQLCGGRDITGRWSATKRTRYLTEKRRRHPDRLRSRSARPPGRAEENHEPRNGRHGEGASHHPGTADGFDVLDCQRFRGVRTIGFFRRTGGFAPLYVRQRLGVASVDDRERYSGPKKLDHDIESNSW